jgi:hypothetical protein
MARGFAIWLALLLLMPGLSLHAIENSSTGSFNETAPTSTNISNWTTGWTQPATQPTGFTYTTGWNYVGSLNGATAQASGVYLGNGWVITCAHVGPGNFTLNGTVYKYVGSNYHTFSGTVTTTVVTSVVSSSGTSTGTTTSSAVEQADFILFQISSPPALPTLPIRSSDPVLNRSDVAMLGYGDGDKLTNETWGYDLLDYYPDIVVNLIGFWTNDFETINAANTEYEAVSGDSGGGDFICNSTTHQWELAGLNEGALEQVQNGPEIGSAFVQLNDAVFNDTYTATTTSPTGTTTTTTTYSGTTNYATQIEQLINPPQSADTPTMPLWALVLMGCVLFGLAVPVLTLQRPK